MNAQQGRSPSGDRPKVRRGDRFEHARQIVGDGPERRPGICTITRVTATAVYYRNESGFSSWIAPERLGRAVGRWIERI